MRFENLVVNFKKDSVSIPVFRFGKLGSAKRLVLMGGVHGNEINGIGILKEIVSFLSNSNIEDLLNAEIICLPVVNTIGFQKFQRRFDNKDLNRSYVDKPSDLPEMICYEIFNNYIKDATYVLDFHDSGSNYELLMHSRFAPNVEILKKMTTALNISHALVRKPKKGMLAGYALQNNVPVLTIESGGGGILHEDYTLRLLNGFKNFLFEFSLVLKPIIKNDINNKEIINFKTRFKYKLKNTCIVRFNVSLGQKIKKSHLLCTILNPETSKEYNLYSKKDGYIFSLPSKNIVTKNQVICDVALDCCDYNINSNPEIFELIEVI